jgi:hypothetical protein
MIFEMSRLFSCDWDPLRSTSYKIYENRPLSAVDRPRLGKKSIPSYIQDATLALSNGNTRGVVVKIAMAVCLTDMLIKAHGI